MVQTPNSDDIQKFMDDGVLEALKAIEESMKDGSLMSYIMSNNHQVATLPFTQYVFQVSIAHKKKGKKDENSSN